jgi:hypothetical protein
MPFLKGSLSGSSLPKQDNFVFRIFYPIIVEQ